MTKVDMQKEIDRRKDKCDKQAQMLQRLFPDKSPYENYFISGEGGEKDQNGTKDGIYPEW